MRNDESNDLYLALFLALNLMFVLISGFATFSGYREMFGPILAAVLAAAVSLMLFLVNMMFRKGRVAGRNPIPYLIVYLIPVGFSFVGNFNYFYGNFMEKELAENDIDTAKSIFLKTLSDAEAALLQASPYRDRLEAIKSVEAEKSNLLQQMVMPGNCGFGERAREHFQAIEGMLKTRMTAPGSTKRCEDAAKAADALGKLVDSHISEKLRPTIAQYEALLSELRTTRIAFESDFRKLKTASESGSIDLDQKRTFFENVLLSNDTFGQKSQSLLGPEFTFSRIPKVNANVHKMSHSLQSAFFDSNNKTATWLILLISIAIDIVVPIFILLLVHASRDMESIDRVGEGNNRIEVL